MYYIALQQGFIELVSGGDLTNLAFYRAIQAHSVSSSPNAPQSLCRAGVHRPVWVASEAYVGSDSR